MQSTKTGAKKMDLELMQSFRKARKHGRSGWTPKERSVHAVKRQASVTPLPADDWVWDDNDMISA